MGAGCSSLIKNLSKPIQAKDIRLEKKWVRTTLSSEYLGFRYPHRMTPIMTEDQKSLIQGNSIDGIAAYDLKTGNEKWKLHLHGGVEDGAVMVKDSLYFGATNGLFYSVNAKTSAINWQFEVKSEVLSTPAVSGDVVVFIAGNNRAYGLNTDSGKQVWTYTRQETTNLSIRGGSEPSFDGNFVYLGFSDGALVKLNKTNGELVWAQNLNLNRKFRDIDSKPVIDGQNIYVNSFDDAFYCLDAQSGKINWKSEAGGFSAPYVFQDSIYYSTSDGNVISLSKDSGHVNWKYKLNNSLATRPQIYRGLLIFGEYEGDLKVLDSQTGHLVGKYSPGRGIIGSPLVVAETGNIYFISVDANLYALNLSWKTTLENWSWEK